MKNSFLSPTSGIMKINQNENRIDVHWIRENHIKSKPQSLRYSYPRKIIHYYHVCIFRKSGGGGRKNKRRNKLRECKERSWCNIHFLHGISLPFPLIFFFTYLCVKLKIWSFYLKQWRCISAANMQWEAKINMSHIKLVFPEKTKVEKN